MKQQLLHMVTSTAVFSRFVAMLECVERERADRLRVLMYHRIEEPEPHPELNPRLISATPAAFDEQMGYLASHCQVVSIDEVLDARRGKTTLPPRSVLITFDDAYRDFDEQAWPILKSRRLPATLFVPTAFPDCAERRFWWDRLHHALDATTRRDDLVAPIGRLSLATPVDRTRACVALDDYVKTLPHDVAMTLVDDVCNELDAPADVNHVLGWDDLRRLAREGVTLGAHTRTHPLVNRVDVKRAVAEAVGSFEDLEREIGSVCPIFAYPAGGLSAEVADALRCERFEMAFTTQFGINDLRATDPFMLRRINLSRRTTLPILRARLISAAMRLAG